MNIISQRSIKTIELKNKVKLILSNKLLSQITQAHYFAGKTEWSGLLLFEELAGSIEDLDNLVLKADYLHVMDVGTEAFTEITINENIKELMNEYPDFVEYKQALCHTHHSMSTFFSGTDTGTLYEQVGNYNYFLSLIVNYEGKFIAKIAMLGTEKTDGRELMTKNKKLFSFQKPKESIEEEVMYIIDCNVELEPITFATGTTFQSRIEELRKIKEARTVNTFRQSQAGSLISGFQGRQSELEFNNPLPKTWEQPWHQPTSEGRKQFNAWTDEKYEDTSIISNNRFETITDLQYEDFLIKWMNHDLTAEGLIRTNLDRLEKRYTKNLEYTSELAEPYIDTLEANLWELAKAFFEEKTFTNPEKSAILNSLMLILDPWSNEYEFALDLYMVLQQEEELLTQKEELTWQQEMEMYDRS